MLLSPGQKVSNSDMHLLDMVKLRANDQILFVRIIFMICETALLLFSDVRSGLIRLDNDDFTHAEPCIDVSSGVDGEEL